MDCEEEEEEELVKQVDEEDRVRMVEEEEESERIRIMKLGSYGGSVRLLLQLQPEPEEDGSTSSHLDAAAEETMLLWGLQQPTLSKPNAFVSQSSLRLTLDACGHTLSILQSPSSLVLSSSFSFLFLHFTDEFLI